MSDEVIPERKRFTLKDSDRMIMDVIDEFTEQQNMNYDTKELMKTQLLGEEVE